MSLITVDRSKKITVNSNTGSACHLDIEVRERTSGKVVITLVGEKELKIDLNVKVASDSNISFLTINHVDNDVELNEKFDINSDSSVAVAHADFTEYRSLYKADYQLSGQGAQLAVQTASLSRSRKVFNQDTFHQAGNTTAHVNNYGVVMSNGYTDMVVRNTIVQGAHHSSTHQASRLLTYDKTSIGKILPVLYIYDNEVEASHAASLGQPDEDQIYYLETRGLTQKEAISLIVKGYLMPVTRIVSDREIASALEQEIETKVQQND
ncbi:MAG: SufD family Fe-S cluster assembly protein [Erysipelotrichaceae bacterium]|nr:SufD family Fe-S cluster assembly protein [Erysipelotrichaceae bacterium]